MTSTSTPKTKSVWDTIQIRKCESCGNEYSFFPLQPAKHPKETERQWMRRVLTRTLCDLCIELLLNHDNFADKLKKLDKLWAKWASQGVNGYILDVELSSVLRDAFITGGRIVGRNRRAKSVGANPKRSPGCPFIERYPYYPQFVDPASVVILNNPDCSARLRRL